MADLTWNVPGKVDLILGAQLFPYIYLGNRVESGTNAPPALLTTLGYVLMGDVPKVSSVHTFTGFALNDTLQKVRELEELPRVEYMSPEETECESVFTSSVSRDVCGHYSVTLPFYRSLSELGNSEAIALSRFMVLERKLNHTPELENSYNTAIYDYIDNGYLSEIPQSDIHIEGYYIPHHAVVRSDKPLPRIILDSSVKIHTGLSLNDLLHVGPNLQADLFLLLLDFRLFPVALIADVEQIYLQIGIPEDDRKYLRNLFRFNTNEDISTFQFNRLLFALKSSPFLAMRIVRQLAEDISHEFPEAAAVVKSCKFYMDDLVHSVVNNEIAISLSQHMVSMFKAGSFDLVKWSSNSSMVLQHLPDSYRSPVVFSKGENVPKVLGLTREPTDDNFVVTVCDFFGKCTKRHIISIIARLFEVLGLIAHVILYAKLLIKGLWLCEVDWDGTSPEDMIRRLRLLRDLPCYLI
ncbi:uncharacterized protein LOC128673870 [Plodia interpunctella]|uniref:uncharacterized protein LOC128673870 n=1 Tax=Plodia interpunctella TaxID=58824 RepID=UPI002368E0D0|nr:uncharacterized protein LOC128673870 [Plodia interpunctella]